MFRPGDPSSSLYGVSGSLLAAPRLPPSSRVPSREPKRAHEPGTPRLGGLRRGARSAQRLKRLPDGDWLGEARPWAGARASRAGVVSPSSSARPPTSGTVGAGRERRGGAAGQAGSEAAQERRGLDPGPQPMAVLFQVSLGKLRLGNTSQMVPVRCIGHLASPTFSNGIWEPRDPSAPPRTEKLFPGRLRERDHF